jgi:endonuclease I
LRAEDKSVNTQRSNKDFFEGGTAVPDCNQCFETSETFEPPDVTKGDAARSIFYMSTRYINMIEIIDGDGSTTGSNTIGDQATLELWNDIDPVDAEEIHRNNMIFKIQGNRNPYIDNPAWVLGATAMNSGTVNTSAPSLSAAYLQLLLALVLIFTH